MEGSILVYDDNSFLSIPSVWIQDPIVCHFLGIIIFIGVWGHFLIYIHITIFTTQQVIL